MEIIFKAYREKLTFTEDELKVISEAIEHKVLPTDIILGDFWVFADKELKNYTEYDEDTVLEFSEHYSNGKTHTENFIELIKFLTED